MESQPSTSTTTSTTSEQDNMPSSQSASVDKTPTSSNIDPTLSIPNPTYSPLIQQYVTNAATIIASNHLTRNIFIVEVCKKGSEIALWEKRTRKTAPELLPESPKPAGGPPHSSHSYSSDIQNITPEGDDVLNRYIKKYLMPRISNPGAGTTTTVTVSSTLGEETPTSNPTEGSTSHAEWRRTNRRATENKASGFMMKNKAEQSLPNQSKTLFAPIGIAEDLARIQLILCEEIKTEIQAVKESITTIPFDDVQRRIAEATTLLEERMTRLEEQCSELKNILKQRQPDRTSYEGDEEEVTPMNKVSDDEEFFSDEVGETIPTPTSNERAPVDQEIQDEIIGVTTKTVAGCKTTAKPQMFESMCEPSLHSRDKSKSKSPTQMECEQNKKKNDSKTDDTPMNLEVDTKEDENKIPLSTTMKEKGIWLYCTDTKGKTYYFKYFHSLYR